MEGDHGAHGIIEHEPVGALESPRVEKIGREAPEPLKLIGSQAVEDGMLPQETVPCVARERMASGFFLIAEFAE